ncbi:MAG: adenylate/guanylate cyclase domain-containing protein [Candidatus Latescibacteria bacterium]|nr:adenylate/guanylate cyclase domain-containing protein [Candidatus Latescibacterota bacterium]
MQIYATAKSLPTPGTQPAAPASRPSLAREALKSSVFYLLCTGLLSVYGTEVCPFLESLAPGQLVSILAVALTLGFALRWLLICRLRLQEAARPEEVELGRPWHYLRVDFCTWLAIGLLVTLWNALNYDFPLGSGLKVVLACATLGMFTATSLALDVERGIIHCLSADTGMNVLKRGRFLSISTKFLGFIALCVGLIAVVLLLLIYKDFQFVIERYASGVPFKFIWIVQEILFVFATLLAGTLIVMRKYSRNLQLMFDLQLGALGSVREGDYNAFVPVVSNDEFSLIAERTNEMIAGLKERERIKTIFGKYVNSTVASQILGQAGGADLGGKEIEVAILFTDLRNFTPLSERCTPHQVVEILNQYFSLVVQEIHRHGGEVDKFIGDAAMAIFGLGGKGNPCQEALGAALAIRRILSVINQDLAARQLPGVDNGIGLHYGQVIAGNIGSPERLEYTVIGDAVNVAARLEQLTRSLPSPLAISEEVYIRIGEEARAGLGHLGEHTLKGKVAPLPVYGLAPVK